MIVKDLMLHTHIKILRLPYLANIASRKNFNVNTFDFFSLDVTLMVRM